MTILRKAHIRGRDGQLGISVLSSEEGVVVITFDGAPINKNINLPPWTVAVSSSDKWDLVRENIIELPDGALNNYSLCRIKKAIISQLTQSQSS